MSGHLSHRGRAPGAAEAALRPTWTSPGRVDGPAWPCTGRGLPGRRVTATPVRSYRTISPLPVRDSRVAAPSAVYFCGTFPRVSPGGRYPPPCPLVSGLSSRGFLSPRGRSARTSMVARGGRCNRAIAADIAWPRCGPPSSPERAAGSGARSRSSWPAAAFSSTHRHRRRRRRAHRGRDRRRRAISPALDVRDEAACRALAAEAATRGGSLDLWVNNAGVLVTGASWEQDEATRRTMLEVNALGTMNGTVAALEPMIAAGRGHVINVISLAGHRRRAGRGHLLGEQARGDGLHPRHPLRPAPRRDQGHRALRRLPRRDLDADAGGQARRPRRGRLLLRPACSPPSRSRPRSAS